MAKENLSIIDSRRTMYLTSMLSETLPEEMITRATLEDLDLDPEAFYGLILINFSNQLKNIIESKESAKIAHWKSDLHQHLMSPLDTAFTKGICILNLAPYTRTIIFSHRIKEPNALKKHLLTWLSTCVAYLDTNDYGTIVAAAEILPLPIYDIGKINKRLRLLMDYSYVVGMRQLMVYQQFNFDTNYNITEYKYLQRFESLLSIEQFTELMTLSRDIRGHLIKHHMNNSKVIYVYKELLAILIRYLYKQETNNLEKITTLNQTIMTFEDKFDDIYEVTDYLIALLSEINTLDSNQNKAYHPHIKKVLNIIERRYNTDIGLGVIAEELKLSGAYLSRLFKEEMGVGFKTYLTKYRLKKIKDMLGYSTKTIGEISKEVGYNSSDQMTRIFKKFEQQTPSEYRHQHL